MICNNRPLRRCIGIEIKEDVGVKSLERQNCLDSSGMVFNGPWKASILYHCGFCKWGGGGGNTSKKTQH
jgi:hypothetical protein